MPAKTAELCPSTHKCFLLNVRRILGIAEHVVGKREHTLLVPPNE